LAGVTSAESPAATLVVHRVEEVAYQQHPFLKQLAEPPGRDDTTAAELPASRQAGGGTQAICQTHH
jgi:hypothetical protein